MPEWTERTDADPGIALLQLFSWLTGDLSYRAAGIPPRGGVVARRLAEAAWDLADDGASRAPCGVERVVYFDGRLLNANDFRDEQDYVRARLRRRNRRLHGFGVVSGLDVAVSPGRGGRSPSVTVAPGFALDPQGEEIEVCEPAVAPLPARGRRLFVQILFAERPRAPLPAPGSGTKGGASRFSRVEEVFSIVLTPTVRADSVPIARLTARLGRWRVDPTFKAPRARGSAARLTSSGPA